jgi:hypothetical protein
MKPEEKIRNDLREFLQVRGWLVEIMHGNMYQSGIPDAYLFRRDAGPRWVDFKTPNRYSFTRAQRRKWPQWERHGVGIWVLTAATQEEYDKLFGPPNWRDYWKDSWGVLDPQDAIDKAIDEASE